MNLLDFLCEGQTLAGMDSQTIAGTPVETLKKLIQNNMNDALSFVDTMKSKVNLDETEQSAYDAVQKAMEAISAGEGDSSITDGGNDNAGLTKGQNELIGDQWVVKSRGQKEALGEAKFTSIADNYMEPEGDTWVPKKNLPEDIKITRKDTDDYFVWQIDDKDSADTDSIEPLYTLKLRKKMNIDDKLKEHALQEDSYVVSLQNPEDIDRLMQATTDVKGTITPCDSCGEELCDCEYAEPEEETSQEPEKPKGGASGATDVPIAFVIGSRYLD